MVAIATPDYDSRAGGGRGPERRLRVSPPQFCEVVITPIGVLMNGAIASIRPAENRHIDAAVVIFPLDTPVARRESIFAKTFAGSGMLSAITPASGTALSTAAHIASAAVAVPALVSAAVAWPECSAAC